MRNKDGRISGYSIVLIMIMIVLFSKFISFFTYYALWAISNGLLVGIAICLIGLIRWYLKKNFKKINRDEELQQLFLRFRKVIVLILKRLNALKYLIIPIATVLWFVLDSNMSEYIYLFSSKMSIYLIAFLSWWTLKMIALLIFKISMPGMFKAFFIAF